MPDANRPDLASQVTQITDPLLQAIKAKGPAEGLLLATLDRVLQDAGPRQAEVLRRCAVPRWVDVGVLAVLRGKNEGNERVLELLKGYSFVRQLGPDRYAYHDQVRVALLDEWRATAPEELRQLHLLLYDYFTRQLRAIREPLPRERGATPTKQVRQALPMDAADIWQREALYHLLRADPQRGLDELRMVFDELIVGHRLAEAEALLQTAVDVPLDANKHALLRYLRARLDAGALRLDTAAEQMETLCSDPTLSDQLRAEIQRSLGEVYAETGRWAQAIELYRAGLDYFEAQGDDRAAAEVMLLLGEAYQGLATNAGGWHAAALAPSAVLRWWARGWEWLLSLPFVLIAWTLRRTPWQLPLARYCAHYQNWLLIRLYRTAQYWFAHARTVYSRVGDDDGLLRADLHLARIILTYGYVNEAIRRLKALLERPLAQDLYRRSSIERSLAEALLETGEIEAATTMLTRVLDVCRAVGDVRREASALAMQGRAATLAGDGEQALAAYRSGLDRFRALRYTAARELILYDLRFWSRHLSRSSPYRARIAELIAVEPEKRYVGRFPRRFLALLRGASLLTLPLTLVLMVWIAPTPLVQTLAGGQPLSLQIVFDPLRALAVAGVLLVLYLTSYAALALLVIMLLPINRINREQPDYIVTAPDGIARYNSQGTLAQQIAWESVRRRISFDCCLWNRPLPLYSSTFLEDSAGNDLRIDGITGWYPSLQIDIGHHLANMQHPIDRRDLGYIILWSRSGAACVLQLLLVLIYTGAENGYLWLSLLRLLPPLAYTLFGFFTFSSVLILVPLAFWLAQRPLSVRRVLALDDRWPTWVIGIGMVPIVAFLVSGGNALTLSSLTYSSLLRVLNYSTLLWGVYMVAASIGALLFERLRLLRRVLVIVPLLLTLAAITPTLLSVFLDGYASVATRRAALIKSSRPDTGAAMSAAAEASAASGWAYSVNSDPVNLINQGNALFYADQYAQAIESYTRAINAATPNSAEQALAYYNRSRAYAKNNAPQQAQSDISWAHRICTSSSVESDATCQNIVQHTN